MQELLGHEVIIEPEWQLLLAELEQFYPDKGNFVTIIAGCVEAWVKSMIELLDDSAHEDWTEIVLEKSKSGRLRLFLEVSTSDIASTSWSEERSGFIITLPKKKVFQPAELFPIFRGKLLTCFEAPKKPQLPIRQGQGAADEWADVELDTATGKPEVVEKARGSSASRPKTTVEFLPNVQSLPRPDELFLRPPYHLTVIPGHSEIEIQCSHSPSLKVLSDYLKRWCRINHHDTTEVSLHPSSHEHQLTTVSIAGSRSSDALAICIRPRRTVRSAGSQHQGNQIHQPIPRDHPDGRRPDRRSAGI